MLRLFYAYLTGERHTLFVQSLLNHSSFTVREFPLKPVHSFGHPGTSPHTSIAAAHPDSKQIAAAHLHSIVCYTLPVS